MSNSAIWWTLACQAPLSMGSSRQEYWSGLLCPPPGHLHHPGIKPVSLMFPALVAGFFTTSTTWKAHESVISIHISHPSSFFLIPCLHFWWQLFSVLTISSSDNVLSSSSSLPVKHLFLKVLDPNIYHFPTLFSNPSSPLTMWFFPHPHNQASTSTQTFSVPTPGCWSRLKEVPWPCSMAPHPAVVLTLSWAPTRRWPSSSHRFHLLPTQMLPQTLLIPFRFLPHQPLLHSQKFITGKLQGKE